MLLYVFLFHGVLHHVIFTSSLKYEKYFTAVTSSLLMQLKLKHTISDEILIYPGYVPATGVKYRVFHYGLRFSVGNWSFDKADWRNVDVVNKCWAKFPDPPDSSTLGEDNKEDLQRDLLSIECAKTLNEALNLHHQRKCSSDNSLTSEGEEKKEEIVVSRVSNQDANDDSTNNNITTEESESVQKDEMPSSFRFWMIFLWAFSGVGFLVVIFMVYSGHRRRGARSKQGRRRRNLHSGFMEMNGRDRRSDVSL